MRHAIIFLLLFFVTSCTLTQKLWHPSYEDTVGRFMISQNGEYVVFLGKNYHYVFNDNSNIVKDLLFSPYHFLLSIDSIETHIKLSRSNDLEANIVVKPNVGELDPIASQQFYNFGFRYNSDHELALRIKLYGKRYFADRDFSDIASPLNRQYSIKIYEEISTTKKIENAALTPITLTIDATLTIGKILLLPLSGN